MIYVYDCPWNGSKIMCMSACMHKCACACVCVERMIKQIGLNGNNKWIWVKVYGYSLYCSYSCSSSVSFKLFPNKKF